MSYKIISPARANRTVRGGNIAAASSRPPPNRPHALASCCGAPERGSSKCWYGTPVLVSGGRHPQAQAGNDDEVNHNIFLYDRLPTKMLLDSCVGLATRLREAVLPLEHLQDYGHPDADRDMRILQDCQRVLSAAAWPITDSINHLLAMEYVVQARHSNNLKDIARLEERRSHAGAPSAEIAATHAVVAHSAPAAKKRKGN